MYVQAAEERKFHFFLFFIILSGLLMNTAIVNTENFGIPIFYLSVFFSCFFVMFYKINSIYSKPLFFTFIMLLLLFTVGFLHIFFDAGTLAVEVPQLISKSLFLIFFLCSAISLSNKNLSIAYSYTKTLLKCFILYGIYQYAALMYGFPLFLDFLRNNTSFSNTSTLPGGWLETYRIFSIWSEPSFSALPVMFFLYLLFYYRKSNVEVFLWLAPLSLYAYLTFSRLTWMAVVLTLVLTFFLFVVEKGKGTLFNWLIEKGKFLLIIFFLVTSFVWTSIAPLIYDDLSSLSRSSSVIVGLRIFFDNFLWGTGLNSFAQMQTLYQHGLNNYVPGTIAHNVFVSYAQQMGVFGLILSLLPIFYVLTLSNVHIKKRLVIATVSVAIGNMGGDLYYMPLIWLILALLTAENYLNQPVNLSKSK